MIKELDFTTIDLILENAKLKLDVLAAEHNQKIKEVVKIKAVSLDYVDVFSSIQEARQQSLLAIDHYRKSLRFQNIAAQQSCLSGLMSHSNLQGLAQGVDRTVRL